MKNTETHTVTFNIYIFIYQLQYLELYKMNSMAYDQTWTTIISFTSFTTCELKWFFFFFYIETCITYTKLSYMWWHNNLLRKCLGRRGCTLWLSPSQWKITLGIEKLELQDIYMNKVVAELNKCLWESISLRFLLLLLFFLNAHFTYTLWQCK